MAKVDCAPNVDAEQQAQRLFKACGAGKAVPLDAVESMIALFGDELQYRCCIGNALDAGVVQ